MIIFDRLFDGVLKHSSYTQGMKGTFMHRTFVKFSEQELRFLHQLRSVIRKTRDEKATVSNVVRGIVRDYQQLLEQGADPDFLASYKNVTKRSKYHSYNSQLRVLLED